MTLDDIETMKLKPCLGSARAGYPEFEGRWKSRNRKKRRHKRGAKDETAKEKRWEGLTLFPLLLYVCCSVTCTLVDRGVKVVKVQFPDDCVTRAFKPVIHRTDVRFLCAAAVIRCPCCFAGLLALGMHPWTANLFL